MNQIQIFVNGDEVSLDAGATLVDLIESLTLPEMGCAFSINNTIIAKSAWAETVLKQGDALSLFKVFAGG